MADSDLPPDLIPVSSSSSSGASKIPITLLTGYLGSGKTTLLNYILKENHGWRIAVCMNDFSDTTDIEQTSLTFSAPSSSSGNTDPTQNDQPDDEPQETRFLSLPNGCLCCSIKEPGIAAIEAMVGETESSDDEIEDRMGKTKEKGKGKGKGRKVDWVVVELTGVADPGQIAKSFWQNEEMGGLLRLDGIVCVVDCRNVRKQLIERPGDGVINECQKQIAASDVILLNKTDLVSSSELADVQRLIQHINPTAIFKQTERSRVPLEEIFRIGSYSTDTASGTENVDAGIDRTLRVIQNAQVSGRMRDRVKGDGDYSGHDHEGDRHREHDQGLGKASSNHLSNISSVVLDIPVLSSHGLQRMEEFLQAVHWDSRIPGVEKLSTGSEDDDENAEKDDGMEILRSKGLIVLEDGRRMILQGVRDMFELTALAGADGKVAGGGLGKGKIVFIGKGLPNMDTWKKALPC